MCGKYNAKIYIVFNQDLISAFMNKIKKYLIYLMNARKNDRELKIYEIV